MSLKKAQIIPREKEKGLWESYKNKNCEDSRNQLIIKYQPLVYGELGRLSFHPEQRLDLIQEGTVGLIEAVDRFCPEREVLFSTFARYRIRGRMLNFLGKKMENYPYQEDWEKDLVGDKDPQREVEIFFLQEQLEKSLQRLPAKEKKILEETMIKDRPAEEVAFRLSITTSYLYRLRKRALRRLRGIFSHIMREEK